MSSSTVLKYPVELPLKILCPDLLALDGIGQRYVDADLRTGDLNVALHHVANAKLAADGGHVVGAVRESECRPTRNHEEGTGSGDPSHDVVPQAAREVPMLGVLIEDAEGQNGDRRLSRQGKVDVVNVTRFLIERRAFRGRVSSSLQGRGGLVAYSDRRSDSIALTADPTQVPRIAGVVAESASQ